MTNQDSSRARRKPRLLMGLALCFLIYDMAGLVLNGAGLQAASSDHTSLKLLQEVMPEADSFSEKEGELPVFKAYREDPTSAAKTLIGYVYLTADVPPEANGYSGPIDSLIGIDLTGNITGLKVVYYKESLRNNWGDFLSIPGYQEQFVGKHVSDDFRVNYDVDGISKATITVRAMAKGIRHSIRKVDKAYLQ